MSRSYKKHPYYTDNGKHTILYKKHANKKLRYLKNVILKGSSYKKIYCSYNIHDYKFRFSLSQAKKSLRYLSSFSSEKKAYENWYKNYKRK